MTVPAGMNFGQYDQWLQQNFQPQATTPWSPGGSATGVTLGSGQTADYGTLNGIHQNSVNDANMYAWGGSQLNPAQTYTPQAMTNFDPTGMAQLPAPGGTPSGGSPAPGGALPGSWNSGGYGGASAAGGYGIGSNPYQGAQADAIRNQSQSFLDNAMNGIRSTSVGTNGLGGSREGVAQGVAIGQAATGMDSALANLYGGNWNQDQNRDLSRYGMDQGFYTQQRGLDINGALAGGSLYDLASRNDWLPLTQAGSVYAPYSPNGTTTTSGSSGGGTTGAIGGAMSAAAFAKAMGWIS